MSGSLAIVFYHIYVSFLKLIHIVHFITDIIVTFRYLVVKRKLVDLPLFYVFFRFICIIDRICQHSTAIYRVYWGTKTLYQWFYFPEHSGNCAACCQYMKSNWRIQMTNNADSANKIPEITLAEPAIVEINRLMEQEKEESLYLRLGVAAGGCSGMSYTMGFDTERHETDQEYEFGGIKVLVERESIPYLTGTILEYNGGLLGGGFNFSNPNARRSCGCGSSFTC